MTTESQGVIGVFSSYQDAQDTIKALVIIGGFKQNLFFITDDTDTNEYTVMMYGSIELIESAKVFLQGSVPAQEDPDEELRARAKQSVTRVRTLSSLTR